MHDANLRKVTRNNTVNKVLHVAADESQQLLSQNMNLSEERQVAARLSAFFRLYKVI